MNHKLLLTTMIASLLVSCATPTPSATSGLRTKLIFTPAAGLIIKKQTAQEVPDIVNGFDLWSGSPPRKYSVLGIIELWNVDESHTLSQIQADAADLARKSGGDAIVTFGFKREQKRDAEPIILQKNFTAETVNQSFYYTYAEYVVVKYLP